MILMSHHHQYDTPKDEARVTTATLTAPAQAAVTPPDGMTLLPSDFNPGNGDVICGRGKTARDHEGNISFRSYIETEIDRYQEATSKLEKTIIVSQIVQTVRSNSPKGGFVKLEQDGRWYEVGDHLAREKVGQSLRDLLGCKYKSSTKAKRIRRKEVTVQMSDDVDALIMTNVNVARRMKRLAEDISRGASDDYIGDLFNETNAAILNEIKKDDRLLSLQNRTSSVFESDDNSTGKKSDSTIDAAAAAASTSSSAGKRPVRKPRVATTTFSNRRSSDSHFLATARAPIPADEQENNTSDSPDEFAPPPAKRPYRSQTR